MSQKLVLKDREGEVVRSFHWDGQPATVIQRKDSRRLQIAHDLSEIEKKKIPFVIIDKIDLERVQKGPVLVGELGELSFLAQKDKLQESVESDIDHPGRTYGIFAVTAAVIILLLAWMSSLPRMTANMEKELKEEVVKIYQAVKVVPPSPKRVAAENKTEQKVKPTVTKARSPDSLKRLGALAVLGNINAKNKGGGLNLGAAQTTAGPGLGGNAGSGGVQTSLYAKGLTAAPLGAGGNVNGAGGYGTKGRGGGQEGYGKMSLVGSTGATLLPLGEEATVDEGLDRDVIREVIQRNLGQVRFCYEQGLQSDPTINGRVAVNFIINGQGSVRTAGIEHSTMNSKIVEDCIVMRLKTWKFPLPQGGVDVKVVFPFNLKRTGQG